jgi:hypothetical protein
MKTNLTLNEISKMVINYLEKLPKDSHTNAKKFDCARILIGDILNAVSFSNFEKAGLLDLIKKETLQNVEKIPDAEVRKILESQN